MTLLQAFTIALLIVAIGLSLQTQWVLNRNRKMYQKVLDEMDKTMEVLDGYKEELKLDPPTPPDSES